MTRISDKDLVSRICKELINKKNSNLTESMAKDVNRLFSQEDLRVAGSCMKRCFLSSVRLWGFQMS